MTRHNDYQHPSPQDDTQAQESATDRRYLELCTAMVDATRLDQLPKSPPLIDDVLMQDSISWLHGKPGHAKSFAVLDWACCVATGHKWRGHATEYGKVLYIVAEGASGMHERRQAWEVVNGVDIPTGRLLFLPVAVKMLHDLDVAAVSMIVEELKPALVVVDTQARVTTGADENSSRDMGLYVQAVDRVRIASGACVLTVHHESRAGDSLRGSTALEGAATTVIRATKDGSLVRLDCTKQKDGPEFDPILTRLKAVKLADGSSAAMSHDPVELSTITRESEFQLLALLRDSFGTTGASSTELRETADLPKTTFHRALNALVSKGLIVNTGSKSRTRYIVTNTEEML